MRRLGAIVRFILWLVFLALLLTLILGPPVSVELAGVSTQGMVVAKREVIDVSFGTWTRHLFLDVRFLPRDTEEDEVTAIAAFKETYDQLRVEDPVQVRYVPNPTLRWLRTMAMTRLQSQHPLESLLARLDRTQIILLIAIGVWLTLLMAWSKWRRGWLALALLAMLIRRGARSQQQLACSSAARAAGFRYGDGSRHPCGDANRGQSPVAGCGGSATVHDRRALVRTGGHGR